jgi:hypothetical protein
VTFSAAAISEEEMLASRYVADGGQIEGRRVQGSYEGCEGLNLSLRQRREGGHPTSAVLDYVRNISRTAAAELPIVGQRRSAVGSSGIAAMADHTHDAKLRLPRSDI